jgi:DNA-binding transcriptional MerR regulator
MDFPDKLYYRIGEVSKIAGVPAYVLRFWESEFSVIRPGRSASGQRVYRKKDVELIIKVKELLYDKKFTIEGARKHLKLKPSDKHDKMDTPCSISLEEILTELRNIRDIIN